MYNRWIPAHELSDVFTTNACTFYNHNDTIFAAWALSDTGRYSIGGFIPKDREWRKGIVTIVPYISFDTDSGDVALYAKMWSIAQGDSVNAWPVAGSTNDKIITATSSAFEMYRTPDSTFLSDAVWTLEVDDYTLGIQLVIGRNGDSGSDTMTGDVYIHGAMLKYIEGEKSIGESYDPIRR
jgi:hypothetical protein